MCIRHELSSAVQTSASVSRIASILSVSIAAETSAFLMAKVPPKPQHESASRQDPGGRCRGRCATAAAAHRPPGASAARGSSGDRQRGADSRRRRPRPRADRRGTRRARRPGREASDRCSSTRSPTRPPAAGTGGEPSPRRIPRVRRQRRSSIVERPDEATDKRHRLIGKPRVGMHLAATRLLLREYDVMTEAPEDRDRGLARVGEQRVPDAGDEDRDPQYPLATSGGKRRRRRRRR